MDRSKVIAIISCAVGVILCAKAVDLRMLPPTMGADGVPQALPTIDWSMLLTLFGGSSIGAGVLAWFAKAWSIVKPVVDTLNSGGGNPAVPVLVPNPANLPKDTLEVANATAAYVADRKSKNAQRRFVVAVLTELNDVVAIENPAVAAALSTLGQAIVAQWLPASPVSSFVSATTNGGGK